MNLSGSPGVFGTQTRTNILLVLALIEESHASELARLLRKDVSTVQNALDSLERAGLVGAAQQGRTRRIRLNQRFLAAAELRALLDKMAIAKMDLITELTSVRRRPRRSGKKS